VTVACRHTEEDWEAIVLHLTSSRRLPRFFSENVYSRRRCFVVSWPIDDVAARCSRLERLVRISLMTPETFDGRNFRPLAVGRVAAGVGRRRVPLVVRGVALLPSTPVGDDCHGNDAGRYDGDPAEHRVERDRQVNGRRRHFANVRLEVSRLADDVAG